MFITRLGKFVAVLAILLGVTQIVLGLGIENEWLAPYEQALSNYTTLSSAAEVIDSGIYKILFGVAFGMLAEIRAALDY